MCYYDSQELAELASVCTCYVSLWPCPSPVMSIIFTYEQVSTTGGIALELLPTPYLSAVVSGPKPHIHQLLGSVTTATCTPSSHGEELQVFQPLVASAGISHDICLQCCLVHMLLPLLPWSWITWLCFPFASCLHPHFNVMLICMAFCLPCCCCSLVQTCPHCYHAVCPKTAFTCHVAILPHAFCVDQHIH